MIYLVVESSPSVRESLCYTLLSFGIKGLPVANHAAALEALEKSNGIDGAIIDIDNADVDGIALVNALKQNPRTQGIAIIVHTVQTSKDLVLRMVDLGVAGYLLKPYDPEAVRPKLAAIFSKLSTHNSQRRHIRVKPDPDDLARVSFRITTSKQLVSGRIVDISLGGMAVELFNPPASELLPPGTPIDHMEFAVSGKELRPSSSVVLYKSKILALRFDVMNPTDKKALERYIFKSISS